MQRMKKWFGRRIGSTESLNRITSPGGTLNQPHYLLSKTDYELTSIKIKQLLERKLYQKVVDTLREQSSTFVLKCLESFPFRALNKAVPEAFPIWETLLTKLHNSEDGYIPEFPYKSCDELVLRIAWLIETRDEKSPEGQELVLSCRRVLKCVYMQYNGVLERLYKEHDRVQHSLYTLGLHIPLGSDAQTALSLQQAIKNEVNGFLVDLSDAKERLVEIIEKEEVTLNEILQEDNKVEIVSGSDEDSGDDGGVTIRYQNFPQAPNPNQVQLQERLYQNQCVLTCLQPGRRTGSLPELMEILSERIRGDKEVLAVFGSVRQRSGGITDSESIEPWLRRHQHSIECTIGMIKDIEKDLEIKILKSESPAQFNLRHREMNGIADEDMSTNIARPRSRSYEHSHSPPINRRHSSVIAGTTSTWGEDADTRIGLSERTDRNRLSVNLSTYRPRSASPNKILRVNGGPPVRSPSSKSMSSSNDSNSDIIGAVQSSSSIGSGDIHSTNKSDMPLAFTRVQSLKTNHSVQVVAGKRKLSVKSRNSWNALSSSKSTGNVSSVKKQKSLFRSESEEVGPWERQLSVDSQHIHVGHYMLIQQELEAKTKELRFTREQLHELRRRERELTDRLSEQAQRHLHDGEKFEDIQLGLNRPTLVVMRYQELFSQGRVEAVDAIEALQFTGEMEDSGEEENKLFAAQYVLDALEFAYKMSCLHLHRVRQEWRSTLGVEGECEDSVATRQLESAIGLYLRRICSSKDVTDITKGVEDLLEKKYGQYPVFAQAKEVEAVKSYIVECSKVCWDLCVQTPAMIINSTETVYNDELHQRFFNSNKDSCDIIMYLWPTLLQESLGGIMLLVKGWVQT